MECHSWSVQVASCLVVIDSVQTAWGRSVVSWGLIRKVRKGKRVGIHEPRRSEAPLVYGSSRRQVMILDLWKLVLTAINVLLVYAGFRYRRSGKVVPRTSWRTVLNHAAGGVLTFGAACCPLRRHRWQVPNYPP
jgi:hypothetical protein